MKCPHCLESCHPQLNQVDITGDNDFSWSVTHQVCPACRRAVIALIRFHRVGGARDDSHFIYPKVMARSPLPAEVPEPFAKAYRESCLVLTDSPNASAALSRRCLQHLLRERAGVKPQNLSGEIDEILPKLPGDLARAVDAVRQIGNFAAHPIKSERTGEIVDVEPGEAEWQLEVLEQLFDYYFVRPARLNAKREALNKKLIDAGKQPMK